MQFRKLAVNMGGVLIKAGQFLSTRADVLPPEITNELSGLQDEVPPEKFSDIQKVAETEYQKPLKSVFSHVEEQTLAAASLGQTHRAKLVEKDAELNGFSDVVIKVLRPNIEEIIDVDLQALTTVGKWLMRYPPISRRADVPALIAEFSKTTYEEMDYLSEGKNAETFAENFKDDPDICVPRIVWSHTTKRVLTLEDVSAIKITDYEKITAAGIDRKEVANRLFNTYLQQIFDDGFFHADPHPGNLFVAPQGCRPHESNEENNHWQLTFIDFGMVGRVPDNIKAGLREIAIGIGTKDASRMIKAYQLLGVLLPSADIKLIEEIESKIFDKFWGKSMGELQQISFKEMHEFGKEFREVLYDLPFQIPRDILFLVRCVAILSGMCTGLDPEFNVWLGLTPFANKLITEEAGKNWEYWLKEAENYGQTLLSLPLRLDRALQKIERGQLEIQVKDLNTKFNKIIASNSRIAFSIVFFGLLIGGITFFLSGEMLISTIFFVLTGLTFVRILFK
ncbi:MAG: AarF/ABC1/UbiB kinase family protein [Anaerolineales bacterium]|nr:AarF/ABC1/UbiB kinase family protein [Anaerolineales bacterium]